MNSKYESKWKAVEAAFKKGLNASAEKEIATILQLAKAENNTEQYIKALANYRVSLRDRDEKARLNDILLFEKELKDARFPVKQILHSMLGDLYWTYYTENRWNILERTQIEMSDLPAQTGDGGETTENTKDKSPSVMLSEVETWAATDFYNAAYKHFNLSLSEPEKSKAFPIKNIQEILEKGINTEKLRPTLYDFLVHRAITYYALEENEITKPAYAFEINDAKAFADAATFSRTTFNTSDTTSQKYNVLKLYQEILAFHLNDANPAALIDADIARIRYVHTHATLPEKNDLYLNALRNIAGKYPVNEHAGMASYYIAESLTQGIHQTGKRGYQQTPANSSKTDNVEARIICMALIEKFPKSEAGIKSALLLQQIEAHTLSIETEKVVLPNAPSLAKITYKNISTLFCKIIRLSPAEHKELTYGYNAVHKEILKKSALKSWAVSLPDKEDFKSISTEIKIEALPLGAYALVISDDIHFSDNSYTDVSFLLVSEISAVYTSDGTKGGMDVYVMHRSTGEPLENVLVKTWTNTYNYTQRKNEMKEAGDFRTDKNGYIRLSRKDPNQGGFAMEFIRGEDNLFLNDNLYVNEYQQQYRDLTRTFLFTDRSIYRPGQTIYFKGIMVLTKDETKTHTLLKNRKVTVQLRDVNNELVKELELTTNEYGSFSGTFIAPEGLLTGQFQITAEGGQAAFNVEEYKRPKFEVTYDTIQNTYRLYDEIKVKGLAKAYAGNQIDGAMVKYRVFREARFPYYWSFYRWGQPSSPAMEIANGSAVTKADGSFEISFKAIPDESIGKNSMPVFDYKIIADVTDVNGETRSGSTVVSVSYQSLVLKIETPEQADFNDFNSIKIISTNLGGTHIPTQVTLTCKKLVAPSQTYRSRLWAKADTNSITLYEFRRDFPLDEYNNENDYLQWQEEKTVWTKTITTQASGVEYLQKISNEDGWYVIEAKAKDKYGEDVVDKKYIRLSTTSNPEALPNEHLLVTRIKVKAEPGETAKLGIVTPYEKVFLLYSIERNKNWKSEWLPLTKNKFFS